jgi:transposase InsO family protein
MPWKETCHMDQKMQFIVRVLAGEDEMTALCREYGVSRKTGYKWLGRYISEGAAGLAECSHAPLQHGQAHEVAVVQTVLGLRQRWPHWGSKKLRVKLVEHHPELSAPAASTIGEWLRRAGVVGQSRRRRRCPAYTQPFATVSAANDVWCTDFKGWFRTGDGRRCDPFTLTDAHSRYLLRCQAVARPDEENVRPIFEAAFKEHGLPLAIRSDNGPPFASVGVGGLSRLAVWWIKLGIRPERIVAGKPQQNGRHERVHRTLNQETARPPAASLPAQQQRFDAFRTVYNTERPHEALGQQTPTSLYEPSLRPYPDRVEEPHYGDDVAVRRVRSNGQIKWAGELIFVGEALIGEPVGIFETEGGDWLVRYADVDLGYIHPQRRRLSPRPLRGASRPGDLMEIAAAIPTTPQAPQPQHA